MELNGCGMGCATACTIGIIIIITVAVTRMCTSYSTDVVIADNSILSETGQSSQINSDPYGLIEEYLSQNEYDKAINAINKQIPKEKDRENLVSLKTLLGDLYYYKGEHKKAFKAYDYVVEAAPDNLDLLNGYAYYLCLDNINLDKAESLILKAIKGQPDNCCYLDTYGWILYSQDRLKEARACFQKAMECGGSESSLIINHYAFVLYSLGEYSLAADEWKKCIVKNKDGLMDNDVILENIECCAEALEESDI